MKSIFYCSSVLGLLLAASCSPLVVTPPGFVSLDSDDSQYDYRATTPDGLVISARELDHDPEGALSFWVDAIKNKMRDRGGYALIGEQDVKTQKGLAGKLLRFGHDEGKVPHLYSVAVFVTMGSWLSTGSIYLVEAGGTKELVEKNDAKILAAIQSLDAD
jgi:hypothetical protein